jgi:hypothetical protein
MSILKQIEKAFYYVENRNQEFSLTLNKITNNDNVLKKYPVKVVEKRSDDFSPVLGYDFVEDADLVPHMNTIPFGNDQLNILRW